MEGGIYPARGFSPAPEFGPSGRRGRLPTWRRHPACRDCTPAVAPGVSPATRGFSPALPAGANPDRYSHEIHTTRFVRFRRIEPSDRISVPLHPSHSHLQPAPRRAGRRPSFVSLERLSAPGTPEAVDALRRRVRPPLPATCAAARLAAHPPLCLAGQLPAFRSSEPPTSTNKTQ